MTDPVQDPKAGEPQPDLESGDTSGDGAPQSTPQVDVFKKGYGSGISKGRKEGATKREVEILAALGYESLDEAIAAQQARQTEEERQAHQARSEIARLQRETKQRDEEIQRLRTMADQARLDRLRHAALEKGVGRGKQLEAFVAMHGHSVQWSEDLDLEVVNGDAPTGETLEEWLEAVIADAPFLTAGKSKPGAGSKIEPATGPDPDPGDLFSILGVKRG